MPQEKSTKDPTIDKNKKSFFRSSVLSRVLLIIAFIIHITGLTGLGGMEYLVRTLIASLSPLLISVVISFIIYIFYSVASKKERLGFFDFLAVVFLAITLMMVYGQSF